MTDKVIIDSLRAFGYHGVTRAERSAGQWFIVDVEARLDLRPAAESDLLGETIDYASVVKDIKNAVEMETYTLIEALASRIASIVLHRPEVSSVLVRVTKPAPPIDAELGSVKVEIVRSR